jgi:hypothetical protein
MRVRLAATAHTHVVEDVCVMVLRQDMALGDFLDYSDANTDERPLYLFERNFLTKCPDMVLHPPPPPPEPLIP